MDCVVLLGGAKALMAAEEFLPSPHLQLRDHFPNLISTYLPAMQSFMLTGGTGIQHD